MTNPTVRHVLELRLSALIDLISKDRGYHIPPEASVKLPTPFKDHPPTITIAWDKEVHESKRLLLPTTPPPLE